MRSAPPLRQAEIEAVDIEVPPHRKIRVEIVVLRHEADPRLLRLGSSAPGGRAEHGDLAGRGAWSAP